MKVVLRLNLCAHRSGHVRRDETETGHVRPGVFSARVVQSGLVVNRACLAAHEIWLDTPPPNAPGTLSREPRGPVCAAAAIPRRLVRRSHGASGPTAELPRSSAPGGPAVLGAATSFCTQYKSYTVCRKRSRIQAQSRWAGSGSVSTSTAAQTRRVAAIGRATAAACPARGGGCGHAGGALNHDGPLVHAPTCGHLAGLASA
jgi:hypothetical protein